LSGAGCVGVRMGTSLNLSKQVAGGGFMGSSNTHQYSRGDSGGSGAVVRSGLQRAGKGVRMEGGTRSLRAVEIVNSRSGVRPMR